MGRKFVSIHILNSTIEDVCLELADCLGDKQYFDSITPKALKRNRSNQLQSMILAFRENPPGNTTFYLNQIGGNVSVFSDYFQPQIIKEQVSMWFSGNKNYVLIADYFEDAYLELSVFQKYKFRTSYVDGKRVESVGLTKSKFDVEKINEIFSVDPLQLEKAYHPNDVFETCSHLAELFNLPLTMTTIDAIDSKDYHFKIFDAYEHRYGSNKSRKKEERELARAEKILQVLKGKEFQVQFQKNLDSNLGIDIIKEVIESTVKIISEQVKQMKIKKEIESITLKLETYEYPFPPVVTISSGSEEIELETEFIKPKELYYELNAISADYNNENSNQVDVILETYQQIISELNQYNWKSICKISEGFVINFIKP
jgi:hypothetical protein